MTERDDLATLIAAHQGRLKQLELQQARYGYSTQPEVAEEIDAITRKLTVLGAQPVENTTRELYLLMHAHFHHQDSRMWRIEQRQAVIDQRIDTMTSLLNQVLAKFVVPPSEAKQRPARRTNGA